MSGLRPPAFTLRHVSMFWGDRRDLNPLLPDSQSGTSATSASNTMFWRIPQESNPHSRLRRPMSCPLNEGRMFGRYGENRTHSSTVLETDAAVHASYLHVWYAPRESNSTSLPYQSRPFYQTGRCVCAAAAALLVRHIISPCIRRPHMFGEPPEARTRTLVLKRHLHHRCARGSYGVPNRVRTCGLILRRDVFCPTELQAQCWRVRSGSNRRPFA